MGDRYFITGVQIGMLQAYNEFGKSEEIKKLLEEIMNMQFIGQLHEGEEVKIYPKPHPDCAPIFPGQNPFRGRIQKQSAIHFQSQEGKDKP
jgi:hypothetical protein